MNEDMRVMKLMPAFAQDREGWRCRIVIKSPYLHETEIAYAKHVVPGVVIGVGVVVR